MTLIKLPKQLINLSHKEMSLSSKAILLYLIVNADSAGVYHIDRSKFKDHLGCKPSRKRIEKQLSALVKPISGNRIVVNPYLVWNYGNKLNQLNNPKYNPLNKLRSAISSNELEYDPISKTLFEQ